MNFVEMWSVHSHSDVLQVLPHLLVDVLVLMVRSSFWEIAIPLMSVLVPLLTWKDLTKLFRHVRRTVLANRLENVRSSLTALLFNI
jgi:hypothetical protein